jgi:carbamate kinase
MFVMLTDVAGVYLDFGTPQARLLRQSHPAALAAQAGAFAAGSMGAKIAAAAGFVTATRRRCLIGAMSDLHEILAGTAGTMIMPDVAPAASA